MPPRRRVYQRRQGGEGFLDVIRKANNFLKQTKLISTVGKALGSAGVPYAGRVADIAGTHGYGKRRRRPGRPRRRRM